MRSLQSPFAGYLSATRKLGFSGRKRSPFRRSCRPSARLAVAATDNRRLAPELAAGIARGKSAKSIGVRSGNRGAHRELAHPPAGPALPNAPDITATKGLRDRAITAQRRSAVAALTDGPGSGGFTPEATVAARHADSPELSV